MYERMSELREKVSALRAGARPWEVRLYETVGEEILSLLPEWRGQGLTYEQIGQGLGINDTTIHGWRRREREQAARGVEGVTGSEVSAPSGNGSKRRMGVGVGLRAMVPVQVVSATGEATVGLRVVSPSGYRLEGLTLAEATQVLRELL